LALWACGSATDLIIGTNGHEGMSGAAGSMMELPDARPDSEVPEAGPDAEAGPEAATCQPGTAPPAASLVHRYSFNGTGTAIVDSVSVDKADGLSTFWPVVNPPPMPSAAQLDGSGHLDLDGTDDYVNLPDGLISSLPDVTIMAWAAWRGGSAYHRVFDFGTSTNGADMRGQCKSCVLLMATGGIANSNGLRVQVHTVGNEPTEILTNDRLDKTYQQVALVFESKVAVRLYLKGKLIGSAATTMATSDIVDNNDWLGLSQYDMDNPLNGGYDEFRIYSRALSACEIETLFEAGPDTLP